MCHNILKYCLREALGERQRKTLFRFLDSLRDLVNEEQDIGQLDTIETELNFTLALMEKDFPITLQVKFHDKISVIGNIKQYSLQVIMMHILHHIVDGIRYKGPVYGTWMFPYERFNSWVCKRALNRANPEVTIMETYKVSFVVALCITTS